jgi:hypothetical protein
MQFCSIFFQFFPEKTRSETSREFSIIQTLFSVPKLTGAAEEYILYVAKFPTALCGICYNDSTAFVCVAIWQRLRLEMQELCQE